MADHGAPEVDLLIDGRRETVMVQTNFDTNANPAEPAPAA
jgi:hypothetical protein